MKCWTPEALKRLDEYNDRMRELMSAYHGIRWTEKVIGKKDGKPYAIAVERKLTKKQAAEMAELRRQIVALDEERTAFVSLHE